MLNFSKIHPNKIKAAFKDPLSIFAYGVAVAPDETALLNMLNASINTMNDLDKIDDILNSHGIDESHIYRISKSYQE